MFFRCPKIWARYTPIVMCLNIETPNYIIFHLGQMEKYWCLVSQYLSTLGYQLMNDLISEKQLLVSRTGLRRPRASWQMSRIVIRIIRRA